VHGGGSAALEDKQVAHDLGQVPLGSRFKRVSCESSGDNLADFLTKILRAPDLERQRGRVMVDVQKTFEAVGVRPKL
jgi:hypothetical protein